jgi:hypothetical protein
LLLKKFKGLSVTNVKLKEPLDAFCLKYSTWDLGNTTLLCMTLWTLLIRRSTTVGTWKPKVLKSNGVSKWSISEPFTLRVVLFVTKKKNKVNGGERERVKI